MDWLASPESSTGSRRASILRMADPLVILGLSYAGKEAVTVAGEFLTKILGPSASALGEGIAAPIDAWKERRVERAARTVSAAAQMVERARLTATPVTGRILLPLLEHASLEEDPELQIRWAALLANASTAPGRFLPAYVEILRQLTPLEAKILSWLFTFKVELEDDPDGDFTHYQDAHSFQIQERFQLSEHDYSLLVSDLDRLKLINGKRHARPLSTMEKMPEAHALHLGTQWMSKVEYNAIGLTALAKQFVKVCAPPAAL